MVERLVNCSYCAKLHYIKKDNELCPKCGKPHNIRAVVWLARMFKERIR